MEAGTTQVYLQLSDQVDQVPGPDQLVIQQPYITNAQVCLCHICFFLHCTTLLCL